MPFNLVGDKLHPDLNYVPQSELVNLTTTMEDHTETGNAPDITMKAGKVKEALPLIRKFNRHSSLILAQKSENPIFTSKELLDETKLTDLEKSQGNSYESLNIPAVQLVSHATEPAVASTFPLQFELRVFYVLN